MSLSGWVRRLWRPAAMMLLIALFVLNRTGSKGTRAGRIKSSSNFTAKFCSENPRLKACKRWHLDPEVHLLNLEICLVGNELYQQFPLIGYGGIETSVENIAWALHRMGIPFFVVTPGRTDPPPYPFPVYETAIAPNGRGGMVAQFVEQSRSLMEQRMGESNKPIAIWGQSVWSQDFADLAVLEITSHHDGGGPISNWDRKIGNVRHRFLSYDQRSYWIKPEETEVMSRSRVIPHGLPPQDYISCPDGHYFLWVAGLDWGWIEKGLDIFLAVAAARPQLKFVAYGAGKKRPDVKAKLEEMDAAMANFEFRGELKRGHMHQDAFCGATAFFMPTHHSIGESFGMTVIESLSKGVPVIASTNGAVPEILGTADMPNRAGVSTYGATCRTLEEYLTATDMFSTRDAQRGALIQQYALDKYDVHVTVDALLDFTMRGLEEIGLLTPRG